jgi:hypothetical protein
MPKENAAKAKKELRSIDFAACWFGGFNPTNPGGIAFKEARLSDFGATVTNN